MQRLQRDFQGVDSYPCQCHEFAGVVISLDHPNSVHHGKYSIRRSQSRPDLTEGSDRLRQACVPFLKINFKFELFNY